MAAAASALAGALLLPAWPAKPADGGRRLLRGDLRDGTGLLERGATLGAALLQGRHRHDALGRSRRGRTSSTARTARPTLRPIPATWPTSSCSATCRCCSTRPAGRLRARPRHGRLAPRPCAVPRAVDRDRRHRSRVRDATKLFAAQNRDVLSDPRVRFVVADGRNALLARKKTYDVIISDPSDVWVAGVGNLFTREFYALARARLQPGGVMVQWFHMHSLPPEQMKLIVATFRSVFPYTSLWRPNRGDVILVGHASSRRPGTLRGSSERVATVPGVADDLRGIGFWNPLSVFARFRARRRRSRPHAVRRERAPHRRPARDRVPLAARRLRPTRRPSTTRASRRCRRRSCPRSPGSSEDRDFDARARYLLGFGMASIGRIDPAITLMEQSVARARPRTRSSSSASATSTAPRGGTFKAMGAYARALALQPSEAEAALHLAELTRSQGDDTSAEEDLRAALAPTRETPSSPSPRAGSSSTQAARRRRSHCSSRRSRRRRKTRTCSCSGTGPCGRRPAGRRASRSFGRRRDWPPRTRGSSAPPPTPSSRSKTSKERPRRTRGRRRSSRPTPPPSWASRASQPGAGCGSPRRGAGAGARVGSLQPRGAGAAEE